MRRSLRFPPFFFLLRIFLLCAFFLCAEAARAAVYGYYNGNLYVYYSDFASDAEGDMDPSHWTLSSAYDFTQSGIIGAGDTIIVESNSTLYLSNGWTNNGKIINYGTVETSGGEFKNNGAVTNYGTLNLTNGGKNTGTITNNGTITANSKVENSGTITNDTNGIININNGDFESSGLVVNAGTISGNNSEVENESGGTFINSGTISSSKGAKNNAGGTFTNTGTITNGTTGTVNNITQATERVTTYYWAGAATGGDGETWTDSANWTADAAHTTLVVDGDYPGIADGDTAVFDAAASVGDFKATGGITVQIASGKMVEITLLSHGSESIILRGGILQLNNTIPTGSTIGAITVADGGDLRPRTGSLVISGDLTIEGGSSAYLENSITVTGDFNNAGTISTSTAANRSYTYTFNGNVVNSGTIIANSNNFVFGDSTSDTVENSGEITLGSGTATFGGNTSNTGSANIECGTGAVTFNGNFTNSDSATFNAADDTSGSVTFNAKVENNAIFDCNQSTVTFNKDFLSTQMFIASSSDTLFYGDADFSAMSAGDFDASSGTVHFFALPTATARTMLTTYSAQAFNRLRFGGNVTINVAAGDISVTTLVMEPYSAFQSAQYQAESFTARLTGSGKTITAGSLNITRVSDTDGVIGSLDIGCNVTVTGTSNGFYTHSGTSVTVESGSTLTVSSFADTSHTSHPNTLNVEGTLSSSASLAFCTDTTADSSLIVQSSGVVTAPSITNAKLIDNSGSITSSGDITATTKITNSKTLISKGANATVSAPSIENTTSTGQITLQGGNSTLSFGTYTGDGNESILTYGSAITSTSATSSTIGTLTVAGATTCTGFYDGLTIEKSLIVYYAFSVDGSLSVNGTGGAYSNLNANISSSEAQTYSEKVSVGGDSTLVSDGNISFSDVEIASGKTLAFGSATADAYNVTVSGNWANSGSLAANSSTTTFTGESKTIAGSQTFYNAVFQGAGATLSAASTFNKATFEASTTISGANSYTDFAAEKGGISLTVNAVQTISGSLTLKGADGSLISVSGTSHFTSNTAQFSGEYLSIGESVEIWEAGKTSATAGAFVVTNSEGANGAKYATLYNHGWKLKDVKYIWTGETSADWAEGSNWNTGLVPGIAAQNTSGVAVVIPDGVASARYPESAASYSVGTLTIGTATEATHNASLTHSAADNLTVSTLTNYGTIVYKAAGRITDGSSAINDAANGGTVDYAGTGLTVTDFGSTDYANLSISGSATANAAIVVSGDCTISGSATFNENFTVSGECAVSGSGTVKFCMGSGTNTQSALVGNFSCASNFSGSIQFGNYAVTGVPLVSGEDSFTATNGGISIPSATSITIAGAIESSGDQIYGGDVTLAYYAKLTAPTVTFSKTITTNTSNIGAKGIAITGNAVFSGDVSVTGDISVSGTTQISGSSIKTPGYGGSNGAQTYTGAVILKSDVSFEAISTINFGSTIDGTTQNESLTISANNGTTKKTITFSGALGSSVPLGAVTLNYGEATAGGAFSAKSLSVTSNANLILKSTANLSLALTNSGSITLGGNFSAGSVSNATGATLDAGANATDAYTLTVGGNWENNGTFSAKNSTLVFTDSATASTITGNTTFYNLTCAEAGKTLTLNSTATVSGALTLSGAESGTLSLLGTGRFVVSNSAFSGEYLSVGQSIVISAAATSVTEGAFSVSKSAPHTDSGATVSACYTNGWKFSALLLTWTGETSAAWETASNWDLGIVPGSTNMEDATVLIPDGVSSGTYPVASAAYTVGSVTIGTEAATSHNATLTLGAALTVTGELVNYGTLSLAENDVTAASFTNNGTLSMAGSQTIQAEKSNGAESTIEYTGAGLSALAWGSEYENLVFSSGASGAVSSELTVAGVTTIANGSAATLSLVSANNAFTGGVILSNAGTVSLNANGTISLKKASDTTKITCNSLALYTSASAEAPFSAQWLTIGNATTFTASGDVAVSSALVNNGTLSIGSNALSFDSYSGSSDAITASAGGSIRATSGGTISALTLSADSDGVFSISGGSGLSIASAVYDGVSITTAGVVSLPECAGEDSIGALTVSGRQATLSGNAALESVSIASGAELSIGSSSAAAFTLTVSGNWENSGTFTAKNSTVVFSDNAEISGSTTFYNLTAQTGGKTLTVNDTQTVLDSLKLAGAENNLITILGSGQFVTSIANFSGEYLSVGSSIKIGETSTIISGAFSVDSSVPDTQSGASVTDCYTNGWKFSALEITWTGATSTDWAEATNWDFGIVPGSTNMQDAKVIIPDSLSNYPLTNTAYTVTSITVGTEDATTHNATLTLGAALNATDTITNYGTLNLATFGVSATEIKNYGTLNLAGSQAITGTKTNGENSTVEYFGSALSSLPWGASYVNLSFLTGAAGTISDALTVSGATTISNTSANTLSLTSSANSFSGGVVLNNAGTVSLNANGTISLKKASDTTKITCNSLALYNSATTDSALEASYITIGTSTTLSAKGAITATSALVNNGTLSLLSNALSFASYTGSGDKITASAGGSITQSGTNPATISSLALTPSGTAAFSLNGGTGLTLSAATYGAASLKTTGSVNLAAPTDTDTIGALTVSSGTATLGGNTAFSSVSIASGATLAAGLNETDAYTLTVGGNWENSNTSGGFTANNSTVQFTGSNAAISGNQTFCNAVFSGSNTVTGSNTLTTFTAQTGGKTLTVNATQTVLDSLKLSGEENNLITILGSGQFVTSIANFSGEYLCIGMSITITQTAGSVKANVFEARESLPVENNSQAFITVGKNGWKIMNNIIISETIAPVGSKTVYIKFDSKLYASDAQTPLTSASDINELSSNITVATYSAKSVKVCKNEDDLSIIAVTIDGFITLDNVLKDVVKVSQNSIIYGENGATFIDDCEHCVSHCIVNAVEVMYAKASFSDSQDLPDAYTARSFSSNAGKDGYVLFSDTDDYGITIATHVASKADSSGNLDFSGSFSGSLLMYAKKSALKNSSTDLYNDENALKIKDSAAGASYLRNFSIDFADTAFSDCISGDVIEFMFVYAKSDGSDFTRDDGTGEKISLPVYRAIDSDCNLDTWRFTLSGVKSQRGGVTILNNVINSLQKEKTTVLVETPSSGNLSVYVMTLDGRIVKTLCKTRVKSGKHYFTWNGTNGAGKAVARGMYFVRVLSSDIDETRKVLVIKE